jgi:hypothetical protein
MRSNMASSPRLFRVRSRGVRRALYTVSCPIGAPASSRRRTVTQPIGSGGGSPSTYSNSKVQTPKHVDDVATVAEPALVALAEHGLQLL